MKRPILIFSLFILMLPLSGWASWGVSSEVASMPYAQKDALSDRERLLRVEERLHSLAQHVSSPSDQFNQAMKQVQKLTREIERLKSEIKRLQLSERSFQQAMRKQMAAHVGAVRAALERKMKTSELSNKAKQSNASEQLVKAEVEAVAVKPKRKIRSAQAVKPVAPKKAKTQDAAKKKLALKPSSSDKIVVAFE